MPPSAAAPPRARLLTPPFLVVGFATLVYFVAAGVLLPTVPRFVDGPLGGGDVAVGIVVGAFSLTAFLLRPFAGRLGDRRGRRLLMLAGAAVFAASVAGYLVAGSAPAMVVLRLLTGAGEALFFVGAASAINDLAPEERRGEAVSFFSLSLYVGIGVGPLIGEAVIQGGSFAPAWLISAGCAVAAALLAIPVPDTRPAGDGAEGGHRLVHPAGLVPGGILLTTIWGVAGFYAFMPLYAPQAGLDGSRLLFLVFSAIVIAIRSIGARIPDVLGPENTSRLSLVGLASGLALFGLWRSPAGLFVGVAVLALGQALSFPGLMMLALRGTAPAERGAVIGTFTAFVDLGFGLGPATLGFVAAAVGYPGTFLAGAAVAGAGLAALVARYGVLRVRNG
ncbi:MAG TPA: MFS transporter [Actinomycetota bacterium]|nr:MFS transporter [Actinomycetota bacterium]